MQPCLVCFDLCLLKTNKNSTIISRRSAQQYTQLTMTTSNFNSSSQVSLPIQQKSRGGEGKIVVGKVVKVTKGELEVEVRAGCSRRMWKDFTGVVQ